MNKRDIGFKIRERRKRAGLTQEKLAKLLKSKPRKETISRIETGRLNYTIDYLFEIAEALKCDISDFCELKNRSSKFSMFENMLESYHQMRIAEDKAEYKESKKEGQ